MPRTPVAFLAGGRSPEYEVSLRSARELIRATSSTRWTPFLVRLDRHEPAWHTRLDPVEDGGVDPFTTGEWATLAPGASIEHLRAECGVQLVFPAMHGPFGEDGALQGFLQTLDVPFVGSGVAASAVAIDKVRTRECLAAHGIPLAEAHVDRIPRTAREAAALVDRVPAAVLPGFAKTDCSGSTIGVAPVASLDDVRAFLEAHAGQPGRFLVEAAVAGEEVSVPVLGNTGGKLTPLPAVGIYPCHDEYFTYEAKYTAGACEEVVPPRGLDARALDEVADLARRCHVALGCDGVSRTDLIVDPRTGPVVLETNTIPGFTAESLTPRSAAHAGLSFTQLIDRLFELAAERFGVPSV